MKQQSINIDFPADILLTLNESEDELKARIKRVLAVQLYTQGKVTIGKASQIAEMGRRDFEDLLSSNHIPISLLTAEEVLEDIEKLK